MSARATLANLAWLGSNLLSWRRYRRALHHVADVQWSLLENCLVRNAQTALGRTWEFRRIRSADEFRDRVPLSSYEDYEPFVERILHGEDGVLTTERVRLLEPSSGSTRAAKLIPYTRSLQRQFRQAVAPWMVDLIRHRPDLVGGPAYWSITPETDRAYPDSARRVGFDSDSAYLGGVFRHVVDTILAVPAGVRRIRDLEAFRRVTTLWLLHAADLRLISVWHPSYLTLLLAGLRERWDDLVRDVAVGYRHRDPTLTIPANPARARALSAVDPGNLSEVWPRLALFSCWGDGHARTHLPEVEHRLPHVEIQPKGLLATEAAVTIPFEGTWPLAVTSHVFEFLDARERVLLPCELDVGATYSVVVTTGGGLYRYRLHDLVEVTGYLHEAPCLRFVGKADHVSDLCGEKLSEGFVSAVTTRVLSRHRLRPRFVMLAPEVERQRPGYVLFISVGPDPPPALATDLEAALRENPQYYHCVRLGQLAPVRVVRVAADAGERYMRRLCTDGRRLGAVKPSPLSTLTGWIRTFGVGHANVGSTEHACP